ncbi:MAG: PKD domain-containing protein [Rhodothermaceae bacterium]|nr:PKD domain-containing protein [Rhodothermaceae bacterium]
MLLKKWRASLWLVLLASLLAPSALAQTGEIELSGELKKWHPITLTLDGPFSTETADPNPFLDYRLNVTFSNGGTTYIVPGFFAADGDAAHTSATEGTKWRARFTPDQTGTWTYTLSFREGDGVAVSDDTNAGTPNSFDGLTGSFTVNDTDKTGIDFRARGILRHVGEHYLQFDSGEWFITTGTGSPENFFGYDDFDNTFPFENWPPIKTYPSHVADWNTGDPTWGADKGKGIIGAVNYLSSAGVNSMYIILMNTMGDGKDTNPWIGYESFFNFDVSKLAQWNIVFEHMNRKGIMPHIILQEMDIEQLLDNGDLGTTRTMYYRELIARFGYLNAIKWNIGEEHGTPDAGGNTDAQRMDFVDYLTATDPYGHPVVMHTSAGEGNYDALYGPFLGHPTFGGMSYHIHGPTNGGADTGGGLDTYRFAREWREDSALNGRKWIITLDECCGWNVGVKPDQSNLEAVRKDEMWGMMMAGGAGFDWYMGFDTDNRDLTLEDFRIYDFLWELSSNTGNFFREYVPFWEMAPVSDLAPVETNRVFAKEGEVYVVYLRDGGTTTLDLGGSNESFTVEWFNPRNGGELIASDVTEVDGPGVQFLGNPPSDTNEDWVILVRSTDLISPVVARFTTTSSSIPLTVDFDASTSTSTDAAIVSYDWAFGDGASGSGEFTSHTYAAPGFYTVTLTITDALGNSDDQIQTIEIEDPNAVGAYLEQDGLLVIEAEHFEENVTRNEQTWTEATTFTGYEGTGAMAALPDNGQIYSTDYGANSPYINLLADFTNTGTFYVWVRVRAVSSGNTLHVGLNNTETSSAEGLESNNFSDWEWIRTRKSDGGDATLFIDSPGEHTITIWMREDGIHLDRIVLTTDAGFVPTGGGPAESPQAGMAPTASFTADPASGSAPLTVDFDASASTPPAGASLTSFSWTFGDGNSGTGEITSHTFTTEGTYTVSLVVEDSNGNADVATTTITVDAAPTSDPIAIFTASPLSGTAPLLVDFDATASIPPTGETITAYDWDFGDGSTGIGATTTYTYATEGTYTAELTVTASNGNTGSTTTTITVDSDTPPPGDGAFLEEGGLLVIEAEHFEENITRNGQTWTEDTTYPGFEGETAMAALPDNGQNYSSGYGTTSPLMNYLASFTNTGTYYVWVRVRAVSNGNTLHVGLDETETPSSDGIGSFNFTDWGWTQSKQGGSSATVSIDAAGEQTISVWMREDGIHFDRILLTTDASFIPEGAGPPESERSGDDPPAGDPVASFTLSPDMGIAPLEVSVDASASTPPDGATITSYAWDFGDSNAGSGETTTHTYTTAGTFTVTLTVTDSNGNSDSATDTIEISDPPADDPVAIFTSTPDEGEAPLEVSFDASGSMPPDGATITDYNWDFGDSNSGTGETTSHTYTTAGTFTVTLTVTDSNGNTGSATSTITVNSDDPGDAEMHISSITTVVIRETGRIAYGQATVIVVDQDGTPVADATVAGTFSGDVEGTATAVTDGDGTVVVDSELASFRPSVVNFCVDEVTHASLVYNPDANDDPSYSCTENAAPTSEKFNNAEALTKETLIPEEYGIVSYPNPFNSLATIKLDLPESGDVVLKVYNVLGQEVQTLITGHKEAGTHQITFEAGSLSNALYIYTVQVNAFTATKTMVLVR